jgi:putative peptide zinc metalloprotease protein
VSVTAGLALSVVLLLQYVPFPHHFRAPGVVRSRSWSEVHNETAGRVVRLRTRPGEAVAAGEPLVELGNPELELQLAAADARCEEVQARIRQALQEATPNLEPLSRLLESALKTARHLRDQESNLVVRAAQPGIWVFPHGHELPGRWLTRGADLGSVIDPSGFEFHAVIGSEDADRLFARETASAEVRLLGQAAIVLQLRHARVIPADRRELPSATLGWLAGGPVRTSASDPSGIRAAEPFFEVRGELAAAGNAMLFHGRAGRVRFDLPPQPLLSRWVRALRQLLQKRYQL